MGVFDVHIIILSTEVCDPFDVHHSRFYLREDTLRRKSLSQRGSLG
jgi:hypothetical protein